MKVQISGRALVCDTYTSKKTGELVRQLKLFDGRDLIRVSGVPALYEGISFGEDVSFSVRLIQTDNGMFIVYDDVK